MEKALNFRCISFRGSEYSHGVGGRRLVVVGRCEQILTLTVPILSLNCLEIEVSGYQWDMFSFFSVAVLFQVGCIKLIN